ISSLAEADQPCVSVAFSSAEPNNGGLLRASNPRRLLLTRLFSFCPAGRTTALAGRLEGSNPEGAASARSRRASAPPVSGGSRGPRAFLPRRRAPRSVHRRARRQPRAPARSRRGGFAPVGLIHVYGSSASSSDTSRFAACSGCASRREQYFRGSAHLSEAR